MKLDDHIKPDATNIRTGETAILVSRKYLAEYGLRVSPEQVLSYKKANLYPKPLLPIVNSEWGFKDRKAWYKEFDALLWHERHIKQENSPKENKYSGLQRGEDKEDFSDYDPYVDKITTSNMKVAKELESALNERLKREQSAIDLEIQKENYIPIEEADKTVAVSVRILLSELYNMIENMLPIRILGIMPSKEQVEAKKKSLLEWLVYSYSIREIDKDTLIKKIDTELDELAVSEAKKEEIISVLEDEFEDLINEIKSKLLELTQDE